MDSKFKSFIISLLRKGTQRWKPAQEALNLVKETYYIKSKHGKDLKRVKFKCQKCGQFYKRTEIALDHIQPVVDPTTGFTTWDSYIQRMFPDKNGFQVLCEGCHDQKSALEREVRKKNRPTKK